MGWFLGALRILLHLPVQSFYLRLCFSREVAQSASFEVQIAFSYTTRLWYSKETIPEEVTPRDISRCKVASSGILSVLRKCQRSSLGSMALFFAFNLTMFHACYGV
jgi:hypothetical protein